MIGPFDWPVPDGATPSLRGQVAVTATGVVLAECRRDDVTVVGRSGAVIEAALARDYGTPRPAAAQPDKEIP